MVETKPAAKYLGAMVYSKLCFWDHIVDKAARGITTLSRIIANVTGPKSSKGTAVEDRDPVSPFVWAEFCLLYTSRCV